MKRRINSYFVMVTLAAILLSLFLSTVADYEILKREISNDLRNDAYMLRDSGAFADPEHVNFEKNGATNIRISLISPEGEVVFDNELETSELESHNNRPEVEAARSKGEGRAMRHSASMGSNTFYHALLMDNGYVVRVAKEADSLWSVFLGILPYTILIVPVLSVFTIVMTHFLTKSIVRPIEQMANNLDDMSAVEGYQELMPFINEIKKQHQNIMQSAQLRQEFTANVSHELKTPLTAISGYSELIETGMATDDDVRRFARNIHKSSARLLTLINDIIHLSEMDVMDNKPQMEAVDIFHVARTAVDMLQMNADKHGVLLTITGIPAVVMANRGMMEELVYNLIDNAIRYNKENGSVRVHVHRSGDQVEFVVRDSGIGISEENQERIFERFYRVDKSRSKSTGGTGLGLAIVKHIVSLHDAKINLESEVGVGTTITVTLQAYNT